MTITKREALERCRDQWAWMAETGLDKVEYFTRHGVIPSKQPAGGCWCCEYDGQHEDTNGRFRGGCISCPLNWYAWDDGSCLRSGSVYERWERAEENNDRKAMKLHAASMVYACEWALSELEDGE